jgi:hypothetical protein
LETGIAGFGSEVQVGEAVLEGEAPGSSTAVICQYPACLSPSAPSPRSLIDAPRTPSRTTKGLPMIDTLSFRVA